MVGRAPACLVLDVRLPGLSGLDLQRELVRTDATRPVLLSGGFDVVGDHSQFYGMLLVQSAQSR
jgi:FixJ family two-component response regulator